MQTRRISISPEWYWLSSAEEMRYGIAGAAWQGKHYLENIFPREATFISETLRRGWRTVCDSGLTIKADTWGVTDPTQFSIALNNAAAISDSQVIVYSDNINFCLPAGVKDTYYNGTGGRSLKVGATKNFQDVIRSVAAKYPSLEIHYFGPSAYSPNQSSPEYLATIRSYLSTLGFTGLTMMLKAAGEDAESQTSVFDKIFSSKPVSYADCDKLLSKLNLPANLAEKSSLTTQLLSLGGKTKTGLVPVDVHDDETWYRVILPNVRNWAKSAAAYGITRFLIDNEDYSIAKAASEGYGSYCGYKAQHYSSTISVDRYQAKMSQRGYETADTIWEVNPTAIITLPYSPCFSIKTNPFYDRPPDPNDASDLGQTGTHQELLGPFTTGGLERLQKAA
jgi:hypothetical protein